MIDYYTICNVPPTSNFNEVKTILKDLKQKYEAEITEGENVPALQSQLDIVIQAQEILLDADSRAEYDEQLASCSPSDIQDPFADKYFDFKAIRDSDLIPWTELVSWKGQLSLDNCVDLLRQTVTLPFPEIQQPILMSAILTPSALSNMLPIVFSWGGSGSGKSQISNLVSKVWGGDPIAGASTYAAIRREIHSLSRVTHNSKEYELNHALCWDDLSFDIIRQPNIASMFKSGTNRQTSKIKIAKSQSEHETTTFDCFGSRYISSVHPFFAEPSLIEFNRRMLIIECRKSPNAIQALRFDEIDWNGLSTSVNSFWESHCSEFSKTRKRINAHSKKYSPVSPERTALCTDLLTAGLTWGVWDSIDKAFDSLAKFYAQNEDLIERHQNPVKALLKKYTENPSNGEKRTIIAANLVKDAIESAIKFGALERNLKRGELTLIMRELGWELSVTDRCWYRK